VFAAIEFFRDKLWPLPFFNRYGPVARDAKFVSSSDPEDLDPGKRRRNDNCMRAIDGQGIDSL
jgi:hypothetical protein